VASRHAHQAAFACFEHPVAKTPVLERRAQPLIRRSHLHYALLYASICMQDVNVLLT
jgi:hypothetical protein